MRIAFVGVSHWHAPLYYRPAARLSGVRIVAVSDPDLSAAEAAGRELDAKVFANPGDLVTEVRPDFVFAFGRHCDMAAIASTLIDEGVPFLLEKPGGLNSREVVSVRDRARAKGLHAGTGFNFRVSDLFKRMQAVIGDDPVTHASFRYIAGGPYRYRESGCTWMLDPRLSGGGATINLGPHFVDLFRQLSRSDPVEVASLMGRFTWELPIEDYSSVILRSGRTVGTIETGYSFPASLGSFDLRFSIRTTRNYLIARGDDVLEIHRACDGQVERVSTPTSNTPWYPLFVAESLDRFARGLPPVAGLDDLVAAMKVVDAAYASDRAGGSAVTLRAGDEGPANL